VFFYYGYINTFSIYLESSPTSEADRLMDRLDGETAPTDDLEACKTEKKHRRRRILYNTFDFLAIVMSK
jgi:hypothetical protein